MTRPMIALPWKPGLVRADTAARLRRFRTIAEDHVYTSRPNPIPDNELPALVVNTPQETRELHSAAGTTPMYLATIALHIECRVAAQVTADAEALLDRLVAEVLDCLFRDPAWIKSVQRVGPPSVKTNFPDNASVAIGEADIVIELEYEDQYPQRFTQDFSGADVNPPSWPDPPPVPPNAIRPPIRLETVPPPPYTPPA